jgi:hypothetical protein
MMGCRLYAASEKRGLLSLASPHDYNCALKIPP